MYKMSIFYCCLLSSIGILVSVPNLKQIKVLLFYVLPQRYLFGHAILICTVDRILFLRNTSLCTFSLHSTLHQMLEVFASNTVTD